MDSRFFSPLPEGLRCELCPRRCVIGEGKTGACGIRGCRERRGHIPYYGYVTALAEDPIEKKPLYHFRPGTSILSAGFAGCNLHCPFCQNWRISQIREAEIVPGRRIPPEELVARAKGGALLAYTYSEPLIHAEYLLDCMALARKRGIANVLVTNGCVNAEAAAEILSLTDAANIDLKCFSPETYAALLGGNLAAVRDFITMAAAMGVHTEITTLVVPGLNDSEGELENCAAFIAGLAADAGGMGTIPWHLSAYHPGYRWEAPPTAGGMLRDAARRARKCLRYVYTGNLAEEINDTLCPCCGRPLVKRRAYRIETEGLELRREGRNAFYRCAFCKSPAPFRF
ncbi:MAG: AmmeMemoRadiSam system radical SAM enzyme [Treponema sp.]|nr:AmmeMemoRadiSam system radical SAM enzyme [Treponema sp.]